MRSPETDREAVRLLSKLKYEYDVRTPVSAHDSCLVCLRPTGRLSTLFVSTAACVVATVTCEIINN